VQAVRLEYRRSFSAMATAVLVVEFRLYMYMYVGEALQASIITHECDKGRIINVVSYTIIVMSID
jgi:hypothetical protein